MASQNTRLQCYENPLVPPPRQELGRVGKSIEDEKIENGSVGLDQMRAFV